MGWRNDSRYRGGGFHLCAVKDRERFAARYANPDFRERALAQRRDRYDADPIYRIEKRLHDNAHRRAQTLKRKKEGAGQLGSLQTKRRDRSSLEPDPTAHHP